MDRTIAAISTAMSPSGIGIIRMSGDDAWKIASEIFRSGKKNLNYVPTHTIHHGYIYDQDELIDEVLVMMMRGPRTYTGEDTVEIDCHGGVFAMKRILDTVLKNGAVLAEPGEFTKRAFLNGKMDLSQAEAVMDVIQAKNEMALQSSITQLRGSVTKVIGEIRSKILYQIAYIESALDDPEHIELDHYGDELLVHVKEAKEKIEKLLLTADDGKIIREGIKTVIIGKPNAGKSSLLNMMVGENRAIVTDIAGTTRDVLEEYVNLQGIVLKMIDTAGIRDTEDVIEKIGVGKAIEYAMDADLVLYVVDSSVSMDENDDEIIEFLENRKAIVLYNKTDLNPVISIDSLKEKTHHSIIPISAKKEIGIDELKESIKEMFFKGSISFNDEISVTNVRHQRALEEAFEALKHVETSIEMGMPEDFFSIDLMSAYAALGRITGEEVGEDLVNEIFSKFCTGK